LIGFFFILLIPKVTNCDDILEVVVLLLDIDVDDDVDDDGMLLSMMIR
jgi:hypothetical protein